MWVRAYNLYDKGLLPNSGGWLDQTHKYMSVMMFIDGKITEHKREQNGKKQN